ncbi:MAG: right-handed parallel beta-helix repeat-containing protein, partial [Gemmobacter sp.]|nr:right-handed parallel beta-helix repeat-containing protein [Gemmobacter sp.]
LSVTGNVFRSVNGTIGRVEKVDTTQAGLEHDRARNVVFSGNVYHGVDQSCVNPVTVSHGQNTASQTWTVDASGYFPFGGKALRVSAVVADGPLREGDNSVFHTMPYVETRQGGGEARINLKWPRALKGAATVTIRSDSPQ